MIRSGLNGASSAVSANTLQWNNHGLISSLSGFLSAKILINSHYIIESILPLNFNNVSIFLKTPFGLHAATYDASL